MKHTTENAKSYYLDGLRIEYGRIHVNNDLINKILRQLTAKPKIIIAVRVERASHRWQTAFKSEKYETRQKCKTKNDGMRTADILTNYNVKTQK